MNTITENNLSLYHEMVKEYAKNDFAKVYLLGFTHRKMVYTATVDGSILPYVCTLDNNDIKNGLSLRFKPTREQKRLLLPYSKLECSVEYFKELFNSNKYNKGENYEKLLTEKAGQVWVKDSTPFWLDGDLTIENIAYQIKFEGATLCNEHTLKEAIEYNNGRTA